tara:strand:+ start:1145 stop:3463 length:2319 start_codon:yes stop_codon:yes gene_type:complete
MATNVIKENEVALNSIHYLIDGQVRKQLLSRFPDKFITGDRSYDNEKFLSSWIINDQRGGVGIEEMDEKRDANRSRWSTCRTRFRGHIVLPNLATDCGSGGLSSKDGYVLFDYNNEVYCSFDEFLRVFDNTNDDFNDAVVTLPSNPTDAKECLKAMFVACDDDGYYYNPKLFVEGKLLDAGLEKWTTSTNLTNWTEVLTGGSAAITQESTAANVDGGKYSAKIYSGTGSSGGTSPYSTAAAHIYQDIAWLDEYQGKEFTVTVRVKTDNGGENTWIIIDDGVGKTSTTCADTSFTTKTVTRTLDSAATRLRIVIEAAAAHSGGAAETAYADNVTLSYSETTAPFILQGTKAKYFVEWDAKVWKIDGENQLAYSTDCVGWTDDAKINIDDDSVNALYTDKDANGADIIYAATTQGLWAHDDTNTKWILTQLKMPDHPNSGKRAAVWRAAAYIPAGLDMWEYSVDTPARMRPVGLSLDDGLPFDLTGEITQIVPGYNDLYALVDATEVSGTGYSSVMAWDGLGWECFWKSGTADKAMKAGLVTSAYGEYRLFFATDNKVYHVTLHRNLRNPLKISTETYGAAGLHITPIFDADATTEQKLAYKIKIYTKGVNTNETVILKYRIDRANTDIDTGWTTALTLDTTGEAGAQTYTFQTASVDSGLVFYAIQFRLDLARGGTTTNTPDVQTFAFYYLKETDPKYAWSFNIICSESHAGTTARQAETALQSAVESGVLVPFIFRADNANETHYVKVISFEAVMETGNKFTGKYAVNVIEP